MAKKTFVELVYNTAYIEGCNVTFPQTQTIIDGAVVNGVSVSDIQTVLNLRDAWKYCIDTVDKDFDLAYVCKINELVSRNESLQWGSLRTGTVQVGDFVPKIPREEEAATEIERINQISDPVDRALEYFAYGCKAQLFWDGNKRTSTIAASKLLIQSGMGVLTIDKDNAEEFNIALNNWYLKDEKQPLLDCLKKSIRTLNVQ
ncbi:MAG: Fic family protein [Firmicutes bacterium]|nr:Fic family protein [[Eubacterium] siraeum]MCM1486984.1 Fic family protein [Bacillota bacterium]